MLNSSVLEVAIGLVFLYLSMSLACSALAEYYSALMSRRAKHLRDSLFFLFNKDDPKGLAFLLDFYTHPLVSGLAPEKAQIVSSPSKEIPMGLPWYQQVVVMVLRRVAELVGLVANLAGTVLSAVRWVGNAVCDPYGVGGVVSGLKKDLVVAARATPSYIPDRAFADAIFAVLANDGSATRRIRIELNERLTMLNKEFRTLKHSSTVDILVQQITASSQSLRANIDDSTAPEKAISIADEAFTALADTLLPKDDFELRLVPAVSETSGIPKEGKALVIVGAVENVLHFRVFDSEGKVVADNDEKSLPEQAQRIDALRNELDVLWSSNTLSKIAKRRVIAAVKSIIGYAPDDLSYNGVVELIGRNLVLSGATDGASAPVPTPEPVAGTGGTASEPPAGADTVRTAMIGEAGTVPDGPARRELLALLGGTGKLGYIGSIRRTWPGTGGYLRWLKSNFEENYAARGQAVYRALDLIEQADKAVVKAGPAFPTPERVRDHVWRSIETSMQRLRAAVATLPDGQLRAIVAAKLAALGDFVATERKRETSSLEVARAAVKQIVADLGGTLDGLRSQSGWSDVLEWVERESKTLMAAEGDLITIAKLRDSLRALPESQVRATLLSLMDEVGDDLSKVKQNVQVWFNDSMDRVSGWYKRNTQVILMVISISVTVTLNADTLELGRRLYRDTALRKSVTAAASNYNLPTPSSEGSSNVGEGENRQTPKDILNAMDQQLGMPLYWSADELTKLGIGPGARQKLSFYNLGLSHAFDVLLLPKLLDVKDIPSEGKNLVIVADVGGELHYRVFNADGEMFVNTNEKSLTDDTKKITEEKKMTANVEKIEHVRKQLEGLWPHHKLSASEKVEVITAVTSIVRPSQSIGSLAADIWGVVWNFLQGLFTTSFGLRKLMGLALTAIAASMGAPFWFDLLNKLVNVRSAGIKPLKSIEQAATRSSPA
jgi:hypothetical protein